MSAAKKLVDGNKSAARKKRAAEAKATKKAKPDSTEETLAVMKVINERKLEEAEERLDEVAEELKELDASLTKKQISLKADVEKYRDDLCGPELKRVARFNERKNKEFGAFAGRKNKKINRLKKESFRLEARIEALKEDLGQEYDDGLDDEVDDNFCEHCGRLFAEELDED